MDLNELANKLNKINDEKEELNEDFKNIVQTISEKDETNESRDVKYTLYEDYELTYQRENDKYHDFINSFSWSYLQMMDLYVGEDLPRDYMNNMEELYTIFIFYFLLKDYFINIKSTYDFHYF